MARETLRRDSITDIACQLHYRFMDDTIPLRHFQGDKFFEGFKEKFLFSTGRRVSDEGNIERAEFESGSVTIDSHRYAVSKITVDEDTVYIQMKAETDIVKKVLQEVVGFFSQVVGPIDLETTVLTKGYATRCKVKFTFDFANLLGEQFRNFLHKEVAPQFQREDATLIVHPFRVAAKINVFPDLSKPDAYLKLRRHDFSVEVEAFEDYDRRVFLTYSELEFDKHVHLMRRLDDYLASSL